VTGIFPIMVTGTSNFRALMERKMEAYSPKILLNLSSFQRELSQLCLNAHIRKIQEQDTTEGPTMAFYKDRSTYVLVETLELQDGFSLGLQTSAVTCGGGEDADRSARMDRAAWFTACDHLEMSGAVSRRDPPACAATGDDGDAARDGSTLYVPRLPLTWGSFS
jgi:hypothetical protein